MLLDRQRAPRMPSLLKPDADTLPDNKHAGSTMNHSRALAAEMHRAWFSEPSECPWIPFRSLFECEGKCICKWSSWLLNYALQKPQQPPSAGVPDGLHRDV